MFEAYKNLNSKEAIYVLRQTAMIAHLFRRQPDDTKESARKSFFMGYAIGYKVAQARTLRMLEPEMRELKRVLSDDDEILLPDWW